MKPSLPVYAVAGMLIASSAFASGVDLTANACPGSAGAGAAYTDLDCAGGQSLVLVVSFEPSVNYTDLVGADWVLDVFTAGDLASTTNFWNFAGANAAAVTLANSIPAAQCDGFTRDVWTIAGSGSAWQAAVHEPGVLRIWGNVYRPRNYPSVVDQQIFAARITIDTASSLERGGSLPGCCEFATEFVLQQLVPMTANAGPMFPLTTPGLASNRLVVGCPMAVPAVHRTWGELKSLYR
jgi:hypothetical protein